MEKLLNITSLTSLCIKHLLSCINGIILEHNACILNQVFFFKPSFCNFIYIPIQPTVPTIIYLRTGVNAYILGDS